MLQIESYLIASDLIVSILITSDLIASYFIVRDLIASDLIASDLIARDLIASGCQSSACSRQNFLCVGITDLMLRKLRSAVLPAPGQETSCPAGGCVLPSCQCS